LQRGAQLACQFINGHEKILPPLAQPAKRDRVRGPGQGDRVRGTGLFPAGLLAH
jgi:hypothetical protein